MKSNRLVPLIFATTVSACATPSTIDSNAVTNDGNVCGWSDSFGAGYRSAAHGCEGIAYVLPRALIKVSFQRTPLQLAVNQAQKRVEETGKAVTDTDAAMKQAACTSPPATDQCKTLAVLLATQQAAAAAAKEALSAAKLQLDVSPNGARDTLALAALPFQPDPRYRFFARFDHSWLRNDQWTLATTREGFLTSTKALPQDTTATLIVAVANLIVTAGQIGAPPTPAGGDSAPLTVEEDCPGKEWLSKAMTLEFLIDVDPTTLVAGADGLPAGYSSPKDGFSGGAGASQTINTALTEFCSPLRIGIRRDWKAGDDEQLRPKPPHAAGLVYRRSLPYEFAVFDKSLGGRPVKRLIAMLPNEAPLHVISLPSAALSSVTQTIAFDNGFPTQSDLTRPGEAVSIVSLPVTVLKALFQIPASAVAPVVNPPATPTTSPAAAAPSSTAPSTTPAPSGSAPPLPTPTSF